MGYEESILRLNKKDMKYFLENVEKYKEAFKCNGANIYAHIKLLQPLKFGEQYTAFLPVEDQQDLPIGEYIWVGGERRGHLYGMQEESLKDLEKININPIFLSNYDFDEIKRMQKDKSFAIITPYKDFDKLK